MSGPALVVLDRDGRTGTLLSSEPDAADRLAIRLPTGVRLLVPASLVSRSGEGTYRADLRFADAHDGAEPVVVREIEEQIEVGTRVHETGRVRVSTRTESETQTIAEPTWRETIEVERVPVGEVVDEARAPWTEGDVTVVPVYEEVLVVEKRLVLREEIRLRRHREAERHEQTVELRRQTAEVERLGPGESLPTGD